MIKTTFCTQIGTMTAEIRCVEHHTYVHLQGAVTYGEHNFVASMKLGLNPENVWVEQRQDSWIVASPDISELVGAASVLTTGGEKAPFDEKAYVVQCLYREWVHFIGVEANKEFLRVAKIDSIVEDLPDLLEQLDNARCHRAPLIASEEALRDAYKQLQDLRYDGGGFSDEPHYKIPMVAWSRLDLSKMTKGEIAEKIKSGEIDIVPDVKRTTMVPDACLADDPDWKGLLNYVCHNVVTEVLEEDSNTPES